MFFVAKNIHKITCKNTNIRFLSFIFIDRNSFQVANNNSQIIQNKILPRALCCESNEAINTKYILNTSLELKRYFSKKKGSKRRVEEEEESDSEEEEEYQENIDDLGDNLITRSVPSLRLDSLLKAGLGLTKKKIEQEFYVFKLRINGEKVLKKSMNVRIGDEIDRIRGFSPDTIKYLVVDRVIIKGVGSITGSGMFPVKMEVLKELIVENYEDPFDPSSLKELGS